MWRQDILFRFERVTADLDLTAVKEVWISEYQSDECVCITQLAPSDLPKQLLYAVVEFHDLYGQQRLFPF